MTLPQLAKLAVENYIEKGVIIEPPKDLEADFFQKKAGVFVTIEKLGQLRGCIGTYLPTCQNIAKETIQNAISAATEDWRFGPVLKEELPYLTYTVYILNKPEPIKKIEELNPKKFGIIVKSGLKTGLLLPDLKGVETIDQQISIACQKAGIDPKSDNYQIYKFSVEKYEEKNS